MEYVREVVIGGKGSGPNRFRSALRGVALGPGGEIHAAGDRAVHVFGRRGQWRRSWATLHPGLSVDVSADGTVFVGESGRIEIFDSVGKRIATWEDRERLGFVTAIVAREGLEGAVFAADARAGAIRRLDGNGRLELSIGHPSRRRGFSLPGGYLDFCLAADGTILAANPGKHRVERYTTEGELIDRFGQFGMRDPAHFRGCCNPMNIAVSPVEDAAATAGDSRGSIVVTEKAKPRVKVYDASWKLLAVIGENHFDPACKYMDIAVDGEGRVYVADSARLRIGIFRPQREEKAAGGGRESRTLEGARRDG